MSIPGQRGGVWGILLLLLFGLTACATPARRGVSLSDAKREAAKDDSEKKKVLVPDESREEDEAEEEGPSTLEVGLAVADALTTPVPEASPPPPSVRANQRHNLSFVGTGLAFAGHILNSQAGPGLVYGFYPEPQLRVGIGGYFLDGSLGSQGEGFTDFAELSGEASVRYYLTSDHTLVGTYVLGGLRAGLFFWEYAEPVLVEEDGGVVEIDDDTLTTYSLFVGAGLSPLQLSRLHVGAGVILGIRMYQGVTHEGFDNDIFSSVGYRQFYVEATALF